MTPSAHSPYSIWKVAPHGDLSSRALDEVTEALYHGFRRLGLHVPIVHSEEDVVGRCIVLGANLLAPDHLLPPDAIIFNFEQIYDGNPLVTEGYLSNLRKHPVWDYSWSNMAALTGLGVERIAYCGIGYVPQLSRIPLDDEKDIDILLYGTMDSRRGAIVEALRQRGYQAVFLTDAYGVDRDGYIARAKIVLNVHHHAARIFEVVRVSYLLANSKFVLSENGFDLKLEAPFREAMAFSEYSGLVEACEYYLSRDDLRAAIAAKGHEIIRQWPQERYLADALAAV